MNTQDDNISAAELTTPEPTPITRAELIEKMAQHRGDDWDTHDTEEVLVHGRIGFIEMPNEELEEIANEYYCMDDLHYKITDADTSKPSEEKITQIVKDIVDLLDGTEWGSETLDAIANLLREGGYQIRDPFYSAGPVSEEN